MVIDAIREYAKELIGKEGRDSLTVYLTETIAREPTEFEINRTIGHPIGVSEKRWPRLNGKKMFHAITVDLEDVPFLKKYFPKKRALSLFVSDRVEHEIDGPGNSDVEIISLSQQEIDKGVNLNSPEHDPSFNDPESWTFSCHEVALPVEVFDMNLCLDECSPLGILQAQIWGSGFIAGRPLWLQGEEYVGEFLMQFDEGLVDMNLGDGGIMYVFRKTAFFQCH